MYGVAYREGGRTQHFVPEDAVESVGLLRRSHALNGIVLDKLIY